MDTVLEVNEIDLKYVVLNALVQEKQEAIIVEQEEML
jgi:hypothetical protein